MKVIFYSFNILCIMVLLFGILDRELLDEVNKKIAILGIITTVYNVVTANYISAVLTFLLCLVICSKSFRKLLCQGSYEERGVFYKTISTAFVLFGIGVYIYDLVIMVQSIGGLLKQLYYAVR